MKRKSMRLLCALLTLVLALGFLPGLAPGVIAAAESTPTRLEVTMTKQLIEGFDGYHVNDYVEPDGWVAYFKYSYYDDVQATLHYADGHSRQLDAYDLNYTDGQSATNPWSVGTHTVTAEYDGLTAEFQIEVIKNPIKTITAKQVSPIIENADCNSDGTYDSFGHAFVFTVSFSDGRPAQTGTVDALNRQYSDNEWDTVVNITSDQHETPWKAGKNTAQISMWGKSFDFTVTITETPVKSVTVSDVRPVSVKRDGYYTKVERYNEETEEYDHFSTLAYRVGSISFDFTAHYKDGSEKTFTYYADGTFDGYEAKCETLYGSWWDDYFTLEDKNQLHFRYMDVPFTVTVPVATTNEKGDAFDYIEQNGAAYITDYYGAETTVTVPAAINGVKVAGVQSLNRSGGKFAAYIEKLVIPDSVTSLSADALKDLTGLTEISFGSGIANLDADMFAGLESLTTISVSAANKNYVSENGALYNKTKTALIFFPDRLRDPYESYTQYYNEEEDTWEMIEPEKLSLPDSVTDLGVYAADGGFYNILDDAGKKRFFTETDGAVYDKSVSALIRVSPEKTGAYVMPDTVKTVSYGAFRGCDDITSVKISDRVTEIVYFTFIGCSSLKKIELPASVKKIGSRAFAGSEIESADLSGVETIGAGAFAYCDKLQSVTLGDKLETIPESCFENSALTKIDLPASVKKVHVSAFAGCPLQKINLPDGAETSDLRFGAIPAMEDKKTGRLAFPDGVTDIVYLELHSYEPSPYDFKTKEKGADTVAESVYDFGPEVYPVLPTSVKHIAIQYRRDQTNEWYHGDALLRGPLQAAAGESLSVKAGTRIIADGAFIGMKEKTVDLPEGLEIIGQAAFYNSALETIRLPASTQRIGRAAFMNTNLKTLDIPAGVTEIEDYAFAGAALDSVTVDPANAAFTLRDGMVFTSDLRELVYCPAGITGEIVLPVSTVKIRPGALCGCTQLNAIYVGGNTAFDDCGAGKTATELWDYEDDYDTELTIVFESSNAPVFCVPKGSDAEETARESALPFKYYEDTAIRFDDTPTAFVQNDFLRTQSGATVLSLLDGSNADRIVTAAGEPADPDAPIGTGMKLQKLQDGKVTDEIEIVIPGDVDGTGDFSAADARLALRKAVGLEAYADGSAQYLACDVDGAETVSAADARLILRAAVNLEDPAAWVAPAA